MSKSKSYEQFPGDVCQLLRNMCARIEQIGGKRKRAFDARDDAIERINGAGNAAARNNAKEDHSDSVREIATLARAEKAARNTIFDAIKNADQGTLYEGKVDLTISQLAAISDRDNSDDVDTGDDDDGDEDAPSARPVQKQQDHKPLPNQSKPPARPPAPDPSVGGEGVNEHLKAKIAELGLPEKVAARCIELRLDTVAKLADRMDSWRTAAITRVNLGVSLAEASAVMKTVSDYRKQHRAAMAKAEKEEVA